MGAIITLLKQLLGIHHKPPPARRIWHDKFPYMAMLSEPICADFVAVPVAPADSKDQPAPRTALPPLQNIYDRHPEIKRDDEKFYYAVRVVTGAQTGAGDIMLSSTNISLVGDKGEVWNVPMKEKTKTFAFFHFFTKYFTRLFDKSYRSTYVDIVIESDKDLGEILVVYAKLKCVNSMNWFLKQNWFVAYFTVTSCKGRTDPAADGKTTDFPCYHWIGHVHNKHDKQVSVTSKTTTLKDLKEQTLKDQRTHLLKKRRKQYKWRKFDDKKDKSTDNDWWHGLPSCIDTTGVNKKNLPIDEQFELVKNVNFGYNGIQGKLSTAFSAFKIKLMIWARSRLLGVSFDQEMYDFEFISKRLAWRSVNIVGPPRKEIKYPTEENCKQPMCYEGHRWVTDVEFGRQMLNGVNPVVIEKCMKIPSDFTTERPDITEKINELLRIHAEDGRSAVQLTFEQGMKNGRVYKCDLSKILKDLPTREGYHCAAPVCLLYVNDLQQLIPIAIQLMPKDPVILPSDGWLLWLLAKMHYQAADAQCHQLSSHFLSCHATMEAYCVATMRNIPDAHPVYKLLRPHFHNTLAINELARKTILKMDGDIAKNFAVGNDGLFELIERAGFIHSVHWTNIKRSIKERGVEDCENLPGYYYRDDGVLVWDAIETYVTEIIHLFYEDDNDVKEDTEVQEWAKDMYDSAFPKFGKEGCQGHGFPMAINTREELIEYCTLIIFTGSAQHAAVNFGQFDTYGFAPNKPVGMREEPPTPSSRITGENDVMNHLPDMTTAANSANVTYVLAQFSPDEVFLGEYPYCWYAEQEARDAVKRFGKALKKVDEHIVGRNKKLDVPYYHLRPFRVPNSISI